MPDNPYTHYNNKSSPCYQRLWELEAGDGENVERGGWLHEQDGLNAAIEAAAAEDEDLEEADLPPENFGAFNGEPVRPFQDEDTDDEEPAPDQRRNRNVVLEFVNFARPAGQNAQRVELPNPLVQAQAPVPAPPAGRQRRRRRRGQQANRHGPGQNVQAQPRGHQLPVR
jgi:E3 ubiquitin-protein ligase RNF14